jgi:small-conductance mechanosensitive channel
MNKRITAGRIIYATGIFGLGVVCIISKDFIVGRPPAWPAGLHINPTFAWISAIVLMVLAVKIFLNRKARMAAFGIAALIFLFSVLRHLEGP